VTWTTNDWGTGFTGNVTVTNTGTATLSPWSLRWTFTAGQAVTQGWSAQITQAGATVTATGESWSAGLPPGTSATFGFNATRGTDNPRPSSFTLNGTPCTVP
jgi:beta-glucosidase